MLQHDPSLGAPDGPPARHRRRTTATSSAALAVAVAAVDHARCRRDRIAPAAAVRRRRRDRVPALGRSSSTRRCALVGDVLVGGYPTALAADERYVYVGNAGDATVSRIDPEVRAACSTCSGLSRGDRPLRRQRPPRAADGGAPGHTPLGVGPGTVLDCGPGPTLKTFRVGPSIDGGEQQTTLAADGPDPYSIWAGNENSETIRQFDASLGRTLLTVHGVAPGGLAVGRRLVERRHGLGERHAARPVARIDEHARRIVRRIPVPGGPTRVGGRRRLSLGDHESAGEARARAHRSRRTDASWPDRAAITPKRVASEQVRSG